MSSQGHKALLDQPPDRMTFYLGSIFAAAGFTVFFGGTAVDAIFAAVFAVLICLLQEKFAPALSQHAHVQPAVLVSRWRGNVRNPLRSSNGLAAGILGADISSTNALQGANRSSTWTRSSSARSCCSSPASS